MRILVLVSAVAISSASGSALTQGDSSSTPAATAHPSDAEVATWFKFRQAKYAELLAADPNPAAEIAAIKAHIADAVRAAGARRAPLDAPPVIWSTGRTAALVLFENAAAPRMIVVPAGEFTMGSPATEPGRTADEGPRHRVRMGYPLAVSMFPVVYGEWALFVADTGRAPSAGCVTIEAGAVAARPGRDWRNTGFAQTVRHPATCVSFADATAYTAWLSRKTGHHYRLLSEAEYEWVNRAGTTSRFGWGGDANAGCAFANGLDQDGKAANPAATPSTCHDGYAFTAPVGSLKPNAFGLFDTAGNVASWTTDCWTRDFASVPANGAAGGKGDCRYRVSRGGSWVSADLRAASRARQPAGYVGAEQGFRVARAL